MQGKKRYFVIVLFLLLGLTTFTFASPREFSKSQKPKNGTSEKVSNDTQARKSYAEAVEAVEDAEEDPTLETVENARTEIQNADDATDDQITQLQNRVNVVENTIDVAALVSELEELVKDKETFDTASLKYPTADTEVNKLEEGNVKENLVTRLERVEKILNDNSKPVYTGIKNNQITNEDVTLVVTDDTKVTKTVTLNNETVDFEEVFKKEGTYVVTLVDEAFNEEVVTFTIDKTAPNFVDLKSGNHYETITVAVDDQTATITVLNNDTKETNEVTNGTVLTKDATYKLTVKDAAGNTKSIWVAIDTTKPTITGVTNGSVVNKSENIYVNDKFLTNVKITGPNSKGEVVTKEFTRSDFTVGANNENFSFKYKANYEGEWTVVATDKAGNTYTETFTIDKTAAKKNAVNANVNGYKNEVKEQYATNGNTVTAYISVNEELKHNPTFTFYTNGKEVKVVGKEEVIASVRESGDYPYVYTAKLVINEELVAEDGVITFKVTDIYDKAGNQTADITKMSVGNKTLTLDRTAANRVYSTVRVNKTEYKENGTKYYYVKNGDSFEFAISFNELLKEVPTVTIGGRNVEMKLNEKVLKNENKFLYEGTFEIPANEKELKQGTLEIKVSNVKDLAGNVSTSEIVTNQTVTSNGRTVIYDCKNPVVTGVNNKYYYTTPITIKAVDYVVHNVSPIATATIDGKEYELGTEYSKEGTHEFVAYDRAGNRLRATFTIDYTAPTLKIKSESVGVDPYYNSISFKLSDNIMIDYYVINGKKVDVTNNKYGDANYGNIKNNLVTGQNTIELYDAAGHKTVKTFNIAKNTAKVEDGNVTVNEDIYLVNEPFYNDIETEKEVVINGNGKTVTQYITSADKLQWKGNHKTPNGLNIPLLGDVFSSKNGAKVTVNNITFTGTIHSIMLGNYEDSSSNWFNTEFNNVNIINTKVVSLAGNIAPAAVVYGKATLNNVNIYGTTRSELENAPDDPYWPIYDLGLVNYSNTTLNGGKIGSIYMWKHAKLTVKAGTTVDSIDITLGTPAANIVVEEGATVNKIITKDGEMEYDEWLAQTNFTTVNNVEQFKKALAEGYKKIIIASTLNINENQKFSAKSKTFVTTQGTITMFDVKEGNTLTLEKLVLDGENKYKVDVTKAAEMHNDPYNLFNKYPLEQTRIYENTPLIKTAGTLTLGNGTVIRNYAHQPKNGANKQQYGGPAILVTGGQTTIDGLEFTNNVSQLLTAKNATITINNINVHDTWADGNKAGLIEINADATMDVNNGTFKNNMMSMRSYGLFIANAGTINMKGGIYENNYSTRNGSNTAGSLFGVETTGKIYMTSGTVQNNIGYRAGAFATRWATDGSVIELNGGTIKNNTTRDSAFKNAAIFVQSNVKIGTNMVVEDKVVLRGATAMLDHNGKIVGDVELVDNLGKFNNNGTVTGTIIVPEV